MEKMNKDKLNNNIITDINVNSYPFECTDIENLFCPKSNTNEIDYFTPPGFSLNNSSIIYFTKNK